MKKAILICSFLFSVLFAFTQNIVGEWFGALQVQGVQLRLVFHINNSGEGYSTLMDSPDQGAKGIKMSYTTFENSILTVELDAARILYQGKLENGIISGTFTQGGQIFPLNFARKPIEKVQLIRPQEPQKPYPYYSEEISFLNQKDTITLSGTLTLPTKEGKFPVVILISGSGPQNRDEELMGHKPFLILSDYLTRNGIGVLRFDDRGTFASKGNFGTATTFDFATDVESAVNYLMTRNDIDKTKIGLIGHSEGGIIAPIVAADNKNIAFIVLMAGTAIKGSDLLLLQQQLIGSASGLSEEDLKLSSIANKNIFNIIDSEKKTDSVKKKITRYLQTHSNKIPDLKTMKGNALTDFIEMQLNQLMSPWMLNFIRYNPATILEKVKCPVLAINGSKDLQVPAAINLTEIEKALKKGGNKKITIVEMPGLNHLFQECSTGLPLEYGKIEQTMSPIALEKIGSWIKHTIK